MKKMNAKNQRNLLQSICMVIGAMLGPLVGWQVTGWTSFHYYMRHQTMSVLIWLVVGLVAGMIVGVVISKQVEEKKSDSDD